MNNASNARPRAMLVTGGAGYIGSHVAFALVAQGFLVVVVDDASQKNIAELPFVNEFIRGDFADPNVMHYIFSRYQIEAVFHFAAFIEVGVSVTNPKEFYQNNVAKTVALLDYMLQQNVFYFVFSSTCAVYGEPLYVPIDEKHQTVPMSPYGRTKLAVEFILSDFSAAYGLHYASLRYFNAAGARYDLGLGEQHEPETHLIPKVLQSLIQGEQVKIFGDDYPTSDGTCVRDYIHVQDLATAHILAFQQIFHDGKNLILNIGTGHGYTVKEVIKTAESIVGIPAKTKIMPARAGDSPMLVANTNFMKSRLNWKPEYSDLKSIIHSAYQWEIIRSGRKSMNDQSCKKYTREVS